MKLSVVIPNYNGKHLLENMLPELKKALKAVPDSQIIIYDNKSVDESAEFLKKTYPDIECIYGPVNSGFTKAVNAAVSQAKGEYLLILNNDCFITEKTIANMMNFLKNHSQYCATQPVVKTPQGNIENIGFVIDLYVGKAQVIKNAKDPKIDESYMKLHSNTRYVYGLSATCLLIKRSDFIEVGMFDESFHSYLEDIDLAIRLVKADKKYFPTITAECIHQHMSTSSKMGSYKEQHDFKNWIRIILKNYPRNLILNHAGSLFVERVRNANGLLKKIVF